MRLFRHRRWLALAGCAVGVLSARGAGLLVHDAAPGRAISPTMWGAFFEDINFGGDGGLYAELIKNRGFEFPDPLMGWNKLHPSLAQGDVTVRTDDPFDAANPHYAEIVSTAKAPLGLSNGGFRGIGLRATETYDLSSFVRVRSGHPDLIVRLYSHDGSVLAETQLTGATANWSKLGARLAPSEDDEHAWLAFLVVGPGVVDVDFVSLFPTHTWKGRPGGLRADLVQALADLHPGFLRFPGGCIVEGSVLPRRYQWKNTIGPVERRKVLVDRWNYEFLHRPTPDYFQSFGLGFYEYFQLCEDLGAQPLPVVNCGMACQFNSGELCPPDQISHYVQDALDLVEFANGGTDTPWGRRRAELGHPAPFGMRFLGVGNEQWGQDYFVRFEQFSRVFKQRHPEITLVAAAGPQPDGPLFRAAWANLPGLGAGLMDEHCYAAADWFFDQTHRYDHYLRSGPGVFMGEYAAQSVAIASPLNRNTLQGALAEAAYMTGLEHNSDVVRMASYAPLMAQKDAWQWTPDLIWFDNLSVVRTPDYYVQELFARNRGDEELACDLSDLPASLARRFYVAAARDTGHHQLILKIVNATDQVIPALIRSDRHADLQLLSSIGLQGGSTNAENNFVHPHEVEPRPLAEPVGNGGAVPVPAHSLVVLRLSLEES